MMTLVSSRYRFHFTSKPWNKNLDIRPDCAFVHHLKHPKTTSVPLHCILLCWVWHFKWWVPLCTFKTATNWGLSAPVACLPLTTRCKNQPSHSTGETLPSERPLRQFWYYDHSPFLKKYIPSWILPKMLQASTSSMGLPTSKLSYFRVAAAAVRARWAKPMVLGFWLWYVMMRSETFNQPHPTDNQRHALSQIWKISISASRTLNYP